MKTGAGRVGVQLRRKQLASVLRLLRGAPLGEVEELRVEATRVDPGDFPTGVEVLGIVLVGHEAAVDVGALAASHPEGIQRPLQAGKLTESPRTGSIARDELIPRGRVDARAQIAALVEDSNTIVSLCCA